MENIQLFTSAITKNICHINSFTLCCLFNDICLKDYMYSPQINAGRQIVYLWNNKYKHKVLTIKDMRYFLTECIHKIIYKIYDEYQEECLNFDPDDDDDEYIKYKEQIKKLVKICGMIEEGKIFKEFIDCYRNGYFN